MMLFKAIVGKNFKLYGTLIFKKIPIQFCEKIFLDHSGNEENWCNPKSGLYICEFYITSLYTEPGPWKAQIQ